MEVSDPQGCYYYVWGSDLPKVHSPLETCIPSTHIFSPEPNPLAKLQKTRVGDKGGKTKESGRMKGVFFSLRF